ncbi:hypothetical protein PG996_008535 [Apiospora saccharicola]|uniref:4Fe-4S ferredoxin-type domain-containing protein n=1 Tax=Apiospora saccharicola TaxID=335842 RepID=A0ABR1UY73_9PEZI
MVASSYPSSSSPGSSSFHDSVMLDKAQLWGSDICVPGRAPRKSSTVNGADDEEHRCHGCYAMDCPESSCRQYI